MNATDRALTEQNQLFQSMDFTGVEYMLENCSVRDLAAGECLLQPDAPNNHLYLILEGKLGVHLAAQEPLAGTITGSADISRTIGGSVSQSLVLATLRAGECVGEISLVDGKHPSAFVVAIEPTRVLSIPHDTVWSMVDHSHEIARNLLGIFTNRMRNERRALLTSRDKRKQFEHQATVDALTGLHNRHWMVDVFPRTLHRCVFNKKSCTIMMADIDHFKRVNDTHGHLVGDTTLKAVAKIISQNLRPQDMLARYGGEEFALLLPDTDLQQAKKIAERVRAAIADATISRDELSFQVTISIGITATQHEEKFEGLIDEADQALYRAKELGRNRVEVFG
ncbi:MAG: GGDEF domain-containing protein [Gallionella sp.]